MLRVIQLPDAILEIRTDALLYIWAGIELVGIYCCSIYVTLNPVTCVSACSDFVAFFSICRYRRFLGSCFGIHSRTKTRMKQKWFNEGRSTT